MVVNVGDSFTVDNRYPFLKVSNFLMVSPYSLMVAVIPEFVALIVLIPFSMLLNLATTKCCHSAEFVFDQESFEKFTNILAP